MQILRADDCFRQPLWLLIFTFLFLTLGFIFLHSEDEVQNVEQPHTAEDGTRDIQILAEHHKEAERHQKRNGNHNLDLGMPSHALTFHEGFKVILIEFRADKPLM